MASPAPAPAAAPRAPNAAGWPDVAGWLSTGLKDVSLTDEQLKQRDLSRSDPELVKRFGKGTHYDLKVVIKGDLSTGKSSLLKRLRGGGFSPTYEPSPQISTAKVAWKCASAPEDVICVEFWEVVDRARKASAAAPPAAQLALSHRAKGVERPSSGKHELQALDATVVDVYSGCHGALFLVDPSKPWTLDYVVRELATCPQHLPVAVLLSFRDYSPDLRCVRLERVQAALCGREGPFAERTFRPQAFECSMANCFGLLSLHAFLAVPFLAHKRQQLSRALELNTAAMGAAHAQLAGAQGGTYEEFVASLQATERAEAMRMELARQEAAQRAAAAAQAEAVKWSWLTGDAPPPGPPRAAPPPGVQPGSGVFARLPPGASLPGAPPPPAAPPAAPDGSYSGAVLSMLGGWSASLSALLPQAAQRQPGAAAKLDDFLGAAVAPSQQSEAAETRRMGDFLGADQGDGGATQQASRRSRGTARRAGMRGWDSEEDGSEEKADPHGLPRLRTSAGPTIPSMRPEKAQERALVLGNSPMSPDSGGSDGGRAFQSAQFAAQPAYPPPGQPQPGSAHRTARTSAVPLGGARRSEGGKARDWDASSDSE